MGLEMSWPAVALVFGGCLVYLTLKYVNQQRQQRRGGGESGSGGDDTRRVVAPGGSCHSAASASAVGGLASSILRGAKVFVVADAFVDAADDDDAIQARLSQLLTASKTAFVACRCTAAEKEQDPSFQRLLRVAHRCRFPRHQLLSFSTDKGLEAMVRQIAPKVLLLSQEGLALFLSKFVPVVVIKQSAAAMLSSSSSSSSYPVTAAAASAAKGVNCFPTAKDAVHWLLSGSE